MNDETPVPRAAARCPVTDIAKAFDAIDAESYPFYARARVEEPIFYSPQIGFWVVTRYRDIREILQGDPAVFSAEKVLELLKPLCPVAMNKAIAYGLAVSPTIVDEDPPGHTPHRQALRRGMELVAGQRWEFSPNASFRGSEHVRVIWDPSRNPVAIDRS